jgi:hypothetical protein
MAAAVFVCLGFETFGQSRRCAFFGDIAGRTRQPAPPQSQPYGPSHGRRGWFSQTHPVSAQKMHFMRTGPRRLWKVKQNPVRGVFEAGPSFAAVIRASFSGTWVSLDLWRVR